METSGALETKCSLLGFVLRKKLCPFKEAGRQWETKWETQGDSAVVDGGGILCGEAIRVGGTIPDYLEGSGSSGGVGGDLVKLV